MAAPAIECAQISHNFTNVQGSRVAVLADVSFAVAQHEFVAVVGPSGCGKSTLVRLIAGLLTPTAGVVRVDEISVTGPLDQVGIVFQRPALLPWLDVLANVTFPMKHRNGVTTPDDRRRAKALLELVGLQDFASARIEELSGGMQQRTAIARALLLDPDILLMDEPFSALDALTRYDMSFELLRIGAERPKTVVFITHSIPEALLLANRVIVMSPRPAAIREIIDVPFAYPRTPATPGDPRFNELARHIRETIRGRPAAAA